MVFKGRRSHRRGRKQRGFFKAAMIPGIMRSLMMARLLPNMVNTARQHVRRGGIVRGYKRDTPHRYANRGWLARQLRVLRT